MGHVLRLLGELSVAQSRSTDALAQIAAVDHELAVHNEACALMSAGHRQSGRRAMAARLRYWIDNPPGGGVGERAMRAFVAGETLQQNGPTARA
jgi:hypothetical protein